MTGLQPRPRRGRPWAVGTRTRTAPSSGMTRRRTSTAVSMSRLLQARSGRRMARPPLSDLDAGWGAQLPPSRAGSPARRRRHPSRPGCSGPAGRGEVGGWRLPGPPAPPPPEEPRFRGAPPDPRRPRGSRCRAGTNDRAEEGLGDLLGVHDPAVSEGGSAPHDSRRLRATRHPAASSPRWGLPMPTTTVPPPSAGGQKLRRSRLIPTSP